MSDLGASSSVGSSPSIRSGHPDGESTGIIASSPLDTPATTLQDQNRLLALLSLGEDEQPVFDPLFTALAKTKFYVLDAADSPELFSAGIDVSEHNKQPFIPVFASLEDAQAFIAKYALNRVAVGVMGEDLARTAIESDPEIGIELRIADKCFLLGTGIVQGAAYYLSELSSIFEAQEIAVFKGQSPDRFSDLNLALHKFTGVEKIYLGGMNSDREQPIVVILGDSNVDHRDAATIVFKTARSCGLYNLNRDNVVWLSNREVAADFERAGIQLIYQRQ